MRRAVLAALAGIVVSCSWGTVTSEQFEREFGMAPVKGQKPDTKLYTAAGAQAFLAAVRTTLGAQQVRATSVSFFPTYAIVRVQDPKTKANVDEVYFRKGGIESRKPVKLTETDERELEARLFDLDDALVTSLPTMVDRTLRELALEAGQVSHVSVAKRGPIDELELEVRVQVSGARKDGSIEYDGKGVEVGRMGRLHETMVLTRGGLLAAVAAFRAKVGGEPLRSMTFFPTFAYLEPASDKRRLQFEHGKAKEEHYARPSLPGSKPVSFKLDDVDWEAVAALLEKLRAGAGNVTGLGVSASTDGASVTVTVQTRDEGELLFGPKGLPKPK